MTLYIDDKGVCRARKDGNPFVSLELDGELWVPDEVTYKLTMTNEVQKLTIRKGPLQEKHPEGMLEVLSRYPGLLCCCKSCQNSRQEEI